MPKRVQMRRDRPWRKDHPDAVIVARPSKWGNPFKMSEAMEAVYTEEAARLMVVHAFEEWLRGNPDFFEPHNLRDHVITNVDELRGKDLACWCPLDQPCHADVLLRLANES